MIENGTDPRRIISEEKLALAQETIARMRELALKAGWTQEEAEQEFSIRVIKKMLITKE